MTNSYIEFIWALALIYMVVIYFQTKEKPTDKGFFDGTDSVGKSPNLWLLVSSCAISWIFAKSIVNSANLTYAFGIMGSFAYGVYYLSFLVAGVAFYVIRTKTDAKTLPQFLVKKYGKVAMRLFLFAVGIRLFNEVWSNTKIVGSFFGDEGSFHYWLGVLVFTAFTVIYTWRGGLRYSIRTDFVQMLFAGFLLAIILFAITPTLSVNWPVATDDMHQAGLTFALLAFIQIFSYPFHDPVMTDRGFITPPKTMLRAFILAGLISGLFIILFGFVGSYARAIDFSGGNIVLSVAVSLGLPLLLVFNVIMLTSAGSTLDSTFSSAGKLTSLDWQDKNVEQENTKSSITKARGFIVILAVLGNLPLLSIHLGDKIGPAIISATTISGTMIMGFAPIILLSFLRTTPLHFYLAFFPGLVLGVILAVDSSVFPDWVAIGSGKYALATGVNLFGLIICCLGFLSASLLNRGGGVLSKTEQQS